MTTQHTHKVTASCGHAPAAVVAGAAVAAGAADVAGAAVAAGAVVAEAKLPESRRVADGWAGRGGREANAWGGGAIGADGVAGGAADARGCAAGKAPPPTAPRASTAEGTHKRAF